MAYPTHGPEYHERIGWIAPCRAATTANITIATALNNGDTLDGVTLATGDRVLVKNQSTGSQNGIYIVGASPARAGDYTDANIVGAIVVVSEGTANADTAWICTTNAPITLGTTALVFAAFGTGVTDHGALTGLGDDDHPQYRLASAAILPADLDVSADNTTANATTGHHGLLPKLAGGTTTFLRADGAYATPPGTGTYTDEEAQDAVGGILVDSTTIDFTYTDATPAITAAVIGVPSVAADCSANVNLPANALTDITGCSISLPAGTWEIDGWITFTANTSYALLQITDAGNTPVGEMRGLTNAAAETTWPVSARVSPGSTTTYKLRAQTDGGTDVLKFGAGAAIGTRIRAIKVV